MKKKLIYFTLIILTLVTACKNPFFPEKPDNGGENNNIPLTTETYTGTDDDGTSYTLEITGDDYVLTVTDEDGNTKTSTGKVAGKDGDTYTLAPDADPDETFDITVDGDDIADVEGIITFDDGTQKEPPVIVNPVSITSAALTVTPPAKGDTPVSTAATDDEGYTCGTVTWSPAVSTVFLGNTKYTAAVTLTVKEGYVFASDFTAAINGFDADIENNTGTAVTISLEFDATLAFTVTGIAIKTQPSKLAYTHGDTLELDGLVVTLTFDDGSSEDIVLADFGTNITAIPANSATLSHTDHNGEPVVVYFGELTVNTQNLTVSKAAVSSITFPTAGAITYRAALSTSVLSGGTGGGSFTWADGTIIPTVNNSGYDLVFTPDDAVNYDYSGVSGWNGGTVVRTVPVTVNPAPIINAALTVTPPAKGAAPVTVAATDGEGYTFGTVTWSPAVSTTFLGNTKYTATVTLRAEENYVFAGELTAAINGITAVVSNNTGAAVTLSLEFDATLSKTVTNISVKEQPSKLSYTHGDTLELDGLVVTLAFDDGSSEDIVLAGFGTNISTVPADGATLSNTDHNGEPVVVSFGELTADTDNLTVNPKVITFTVDPIPAQTYIGSALTPAVTVRDGAAILTLAADYTAAYAGNTNAGTAAVTVTGAGDYAGSSGGTTFTINKANPTVTWPTAAAITYGAALSTSTLTGGSGAGTFAWTDGTIIPTVTNSGYQVTFTPTDTANYNTLTQTIAITVNKANSTVTWPTAAAITYGAALSTSTLTGGSGAGSFAWTDGTIIPTVTNSGYQVTFTPTDTANYNTLSRNINVTVAKAAGASVDAPTAAAIGVNSVTLNAVSANTGQTVEYAKSGSASAPSGGWQNGTTFDGLTAGTVYYFFARSASNSNYGTGAASGGLAVTTQQTVSPGRIEYYWIDRHDSLVTTSGGAVTTDQSEPLTITAQGAGYVVRHWYLDGIDTGESETAFVFSSATAGIHTVVLFVEKDGRLYNTGIAITVR